MKRSHLFAAAFALGSLAPLSPAAACSVTPDYRVPNTLELAERADTILLGVVEDGPTDLRGGPEAGLVIRPTLLIKGDALPDELHLGGMIAPPGQARLSDPDELLRPHPDALSGSCTRFMFVRGSTVLFFLDRRGGELRRFGPPFSRSAEDVPSPDSRWVKAVRLYAEVAALPESERRAALLARQAELRARTGDADAQAIAEDIGRVLQRPGARPGGL